MTKDLQVVNEIATMSVRLPKKEEKILQKEEAKNHHQEREGV